MRWISNGHLNGIHCHIIPLIRQRSVLCRGTHPQQAHRFSFGLVLLLLLEGFLCRYIISYYIISYCIICCSTNSIILNCCNSNRLSWLSLRYNSSRNRAICFYLSRRIRLYHRTHTKTSSNTSHRHIPCQTTRFHNCLLFTCNISCKFNTSYNSTQLY